MLKKIDKIAAAKERIRTILEDPTNHARWAKRPVREKKSKAGKADHNERTYNHLKAKGLWTYRADYWDERNKIHHDLFGIFDFLCLSDSGTIGVQSTSRTNVAARRSKILNSSAYGWVKKAGWRVLLLSWAKAPNGRWEAREEWL